MGHLSNGTNLIDIWLVEDRTDYREKMVDLFNNLSGMRCVAAFADVETVQALVENTDSWSPPNIVLMDYELPGLNGVEGIVMLKKHFPDVPIIMLTNYDDVNLIYDALCAGASGYLVKNAPLDQIITAVQQAHQGGTLLPAPVARKVLRFFTSATPQDDYGLTEREMEVLHLMGEGLTQKEIADRLVRSPHTIGNHIRHIYRKLHVNSSVQAVKKAYEEGLFKGAARLFRRLKGS